MDEEQHYTAWVTTSLDCLDQPNADVVILRDECVGDDDDGKPRWVSTQRSVFTAVTDIPAETGDHSLILSAACALMWAAGWRQDGDWKGVPAGYIATVSRWDDAS